MLSPDPIATNGAPAPRGREVWGTGSDCGAGVVSVPTSSLAGAKAVAPTSNDATTRRRSCRAARYGIVRDIFGPRALGKC